MINSNAKYDSLLKHAWIIILVVLSACKKFVTIKPPITQLVTASVFDNDAAATAALTGIYGNMYGNSGFAGQLVSSTTLLAGLSSDELMNFSNIATQAEFYKNTLSTTNGTLYSYLWAQPFQDIYDANAVIEGLTGSSRVSGTLRLQLIAEAKFIRAFCNFYLVNFFGDVPLITSTDYQANSVARRTPKSQVYLQIVSDLKDAQSGLATDYSVAQGNRIRPNRWAATALLSRVYLYTEDWENAEKQATAIINNSGTYKLCSNLDSVFLANSPEAIWQFQPVLPDRNTNEGNIFILTSTPTVSTLSNKLLSSFEPGDNRKAHWIQNLKIGSNTYYYPFKYKIKTGSVLTEYSVVLRLAEQYLIRAEARLNQNDLSGAQSDVNVIRIRASLSKTTANVQSDLLAAILHERQVELFTEWGHRWLDLIRTGNVDPVMSIVTPQKGGSWNSNRRFYPIPQQEILKDPNLTQNIGY